MADADVESMKINILNKFKRDYNISDFRKCSRITQDTVVFIIFTNREN